MRRIIAPAAVLALAACREGPQPVQPATVIDPPVTLTLRVGETHRVAGIPLTFTAVPSDSRCPVDVVCVWSGNAEVVIAVGPTERLTLNSTVGVRVGQAAGLRVTLLEVTPEADTRHPIPPNGYSVRLEVDD